MRVLVLCAMLCAFASSVHAQTGGLIAVMRIDAHEEINMHRNAGDCATFRRVVTRNQRALCAITGTGGNFQGGAENGRIERRDEGWVFTGSSCQGGIFFKVTCFRAVLCPARNPNCPG
jgi:hypothetical protein